MVCQDLGAIETDLSGGGGLYVANVRCAGFDVVDQTFVEEGVVTGLVRAISTSMKARFTSDLRDAESFWVLTFQ